jgi:hypothetical protein
MGRSRPIKLSLFPAMRFDAGAVLVRISKFAAMFCVRRRVTAPVWHAAKKKKQVLAALHVALAGKSTSKPGFVR